LVDNHQIGAHKVIAVRFEEFLDPYKAIAARLEELLVPKLVAPLDLGVVAATLLAQFLKTMHSVLEYHRAVLVFAQAGVRRPKLVVFEGQRATQVVVPMITELQDHKEGSVLVRAGVRKPRLLVLKERFLASSIAPPSPQVVTAVAIAGIIAASIPTATH
jgi:hypothetical protein